MPNKLLLFGCLTFILLLQTTFACHCYSQGGGCGMCSAGYYKYDDCNCYCCPAGTYSSYDSLGQGLSVCAYCPAGYSSGGCSTGCSICPANSYSVAGGSCIQCPAGSNAPAGSTTCVTCTAGKYLSSGTCLNCPAGYTSGSGATACTACAAGYYSTSGATTCSACSAGQYSTSASGSCTSCPTGTYTASAGMGSCTSCTAGTYTNTIGSTVCKSCITGTFTASAGLSVCSNCAVGTYASSIGSSTCTKCPLGAYTNTLGNTACASCVAGKFNDVAGASFCKDCTQGYASSATGVSSCQICGVGTYASTTASTSCSNCAIGQYSSAPGLSACVNCAAGYFTGVTAASVCSSCSPGTFAAATGSSVCNSCAAGSYTTISASTTCVTCSSGSYSVSGSSSCTSCPLGSYVASTSASTCTQCSAGTYTLTAGSTSCTNCPTGSYSLISGGTSVSSCQGCPTGSYNTITGATQCNLCPSGTYNSLTSQTSCLPCATGAFCTAGSSAPSLCSAGSYNAQTGVSSCQSCPVNTYSDILGSTSCKYCASGTASTGASFCPVPGFTMFGICGYTKAKNNAGLLPLDPSQTTPTQFNFYFQTASPYLQQYSGYPYAANSGLLVFSNGQYSDLGNTNLFSFKGSLVYYRQLSTSSTPDAVQTVTNLVLNPGTSVAIAFPLNVKYTKVFATLSGVLKSAASTVTPVLSNGAYGVLNKGANTANQLFATTNIFKRECSSCVSGYKEIFYKRLTPIPATLSIYSLFCNWVSTNNILNQDFKLYSTLADLINDVNGWTYCNYDDPGIGFPRDCGGQINQWNRCDNLGGQFDYRYSIVQPSVLSSNITMNLGTSTQCLNTVNNYVNSASDIYYLESTQSSPPMILSVSPKPTIQTFAYTASSSIIYSTSGVNALGSSIYITLTGQFFSALATVAIGTTNCPTTSVSDTQIICKLPVGSGVGAITVTNAYGTSDNTNPLAKFNYDQPYISSVSPATGLLTAGSSVLTITGLNFGPVGTTVSASAKSVIGVAPASFVCQVTVAHSQIQCTITSGGSGSFTIQVTAAGQISQSSTVLTYSAPTISSVTGPASATTGGSVITISGSNLGSGSTVSISTYPCTSVVVNAANTQIQCTTSVGQGMGNVVSVTTGGQTSSLSNAYSYAKANLASFSAQSCQTIGGCTTTLSGTNFGLSSIITFNGQTVMPSSQTQSTITFTVPAGCSANTVSVTVGNQPSANSILYSFAPPSISNTTAISIPTVGGTIVTIKGQNFCPSVALFNQFASVVSFTFMLTSPTVTSTANCIISTISATSLSCLSPAGQAKQVTVKVSMGTASSSSILSSISYQPPAIQSYSIPSGATIPAVGGTSLTIFGVNFGIIGTITMYGTVLTTQSWSHNKVVFNTPSGVDIANVTISVANQVNSLFTIQYAAPIISSVTPLNGPTTGQTVITIKGSNFGTGSIIKPVVSIGGRNCAFASNNVTDSTIYVLSPIGDGTQNIVKVQVGTQSTTFTTFFKYNPPTITSISPLNGPTSGNTKLTIKGTNFGVNSTLSGLIDMFAATLSFVSNTTVYLTTPVGVGVDLPIKININGQTATNPSLQQFQYDKPTITSITSCVGGCALLGGDILTINGNNFGSTSTQSQVKVNVADNPCTISSITHTKIVCTIPPFTNSDPINQIVSVSVASQEATISGFNYVGPVIQTQQNLSGLDPKINNTMTFSYTPSSLCASASDIAAIVKTSYPNIQYFGQTNQTEIEDVTFSCVDVKLQSGSCATNNAVFSCVLPSGIVGKDLRLKLFIQVMRSTGSKSKLSSQDGPFTVSFQSPVIIPGTLRGSMNGIASGNFTAVTLTQRVYFNVTNVSIVPLRYISLYYTDSSSVYSCVDLIIIDNTISCVTMRGSGVGYRFVVNALNSPSSLSSDQFNYPVAPIISAISGCAQSDNIRTWGCATSGKDSTTMQQIRLTISGQYFAYIGVSVRVGNSRCENVTIVSSNQVLCDLPSGAGINVPVVIFNGDIPSDSKDYVSYQQPHLNTISGCTQGFNSNHTYDCSRDGGQLITITGSNFNSFGAIVLIGGENCKDVKHDSNTPDSKVTCVIPASYGTLLAVQLIQGGGSLSENRLQLSYVRCQAGKYENAGVCTDCPLGTFTSQEGQLYCDSCKQGSYANSTGLTICTKCSPGDYQNQVGQSVCVPCAIGKTVDYEGASECSICDAGSYSDKIGLTKCIPCAMGTYTNLYGAASCISCPVGTAVDYEGASQCDSCAVGKFANLPGSITCSNCPMGSFTNVTGLIQCYNCSLGTFNDNDGLSGCSNCYNGTYADFEGATECFSCAPGKFSDSSSGLSSCTTCKAGSISQVSGATTCLNCNAGAYAPNSTTCLPCDAGSYSLDGASVCQLSDNGYFVGNPGQPKQTACKKGTFTNVMGSTMCSLCPAGTYNEDIAKDSCVSCPIGKHSSIAGSSSCSVCQNGLYSNDTGLAECYPCDAGFYSLSSESGITKCTPCNVGMYQSKLQQTSCDQCIPGYFSSGTGATVCSSCAPGTFTMSNGLSTCNECEYGYYNNATGSSNCYLCAAGTYSAKPGNLLCSLCDPGKYSGPGASSCTSCELGTFAITSGSNKCVNCKKGTYANQPGSVECTKCEPGKQGSSEGQSTCFDCQAGKYSFEGYVNCLPCDVGTYTNSSGYSTCVNCPAGWYQGSQAQTRCDFCTSGYFSNAGASSCKKCLDRTVAPYNASSMCYSCDPNAQSNAENTKCLCNVGYAAVFLQNVTNSAFISTCRECPVGAVCDIPGTIWGEFETQSGYWRDKNASDSEAAVVFYRCLIPNVCEGGVDSTCANGRMGALCALCPPNTSETVAGICQPCNTKAASYAFFIVIVVIVIALIFIMYMVVLRSGAQLLELAAKDELAKRGTSTVDIAAMDEEDSYENRRYGGMITLIGPPPPKPDFSYKLKIALGFVQIVTNLAVGLQVPWPTAFLKVISYFNPANLDFVQFSAIKCIVKSDYFTKMWTFCFVPMALLVGILLFVTLPGYIYAARASEADVSRTIKKMTRKKTWKLFLFTLFLIYPSVSSIVLRSYICKNVNGTSYLVSDFEVICYTDSYNRNINAAYFMIVLYPVGIPCFLFYMLYRYRMRLNEAGVRAELGFLYDAYDRQFYYWELLDMIFKLVLVALIAFIDQKYQMAAGLVFCAGYTAAMFACRPYIRKGDDKLHLISLVEILCLMMAGNVFTYVNKYDPLMDVVLSVVLLFTFFGFVLYFGLQCFSVIRKKCFPRMPSSKYTSDNDVELSAPVSAPVRLSVTEQSNRERQNTSNYRNPVYESTNEDNGEFAMSKNMLKD